MSTGSCYFDSFTNMAAPLMSLLFLTLITGIQSISTVSKVSVKAGASVSIPCLYESRYRTNRKYLCERYSWHSCSYAVTTTTTQASKKYSVSDNRNKRIFTVTINDLTDKNTDYWCVVDIQSAVDDGEYFHLSVTKGTPSLQVDNQEVTGYIGEEITINCNYTTSGRTAWCKLGHTCVTQESGSIDGTRVTINTTISNVFRVTLSELRPESSGWYWCVKGDFQMPVHLFVIVKPTVTLRPVTQTELISTVKSEQNRSSVELKDLLIPLSVLIFIVIVALFVCLVLKRKNAKADSATTELNEEDVVYTEVSFKMKKSAQDLNTECDTDVTYSSVIMTQ